jgi:hypothetical protein
MCSTWVSVPGQASRGPGTEGATIMAGPPWGKHGSV